MAGEEEEPTMGKGGGGSDKLILRGLQFHGFHGVKQEEKKLGQKFVVDVDAWMDLSAAGDSPDTVSYTDIYRNLSASDLGAALAKAAIYLRLSNGYLQLVANWGFDDIFDLKLGPSKKD